VSPSGCQQCHSSDVNIGTQPLLRTISHKPLVDAPQIGSNLGPIGKGLGNESITSSVGISQRFAALPSSREAAQSAALRRWNNELLDRFRSTPLYAVIIDAIDTELQNAATEAELKRKGAGLACIVQQLTMRQVLPPTIHQQGGG
jgi:hypothetical protein